LFSRNGSVWSPITPWIVQTSYFRDLITDLMAGRSSSTGMRMAAQVADSGRLPSPSDPYEYEREPVLPLFFCALASLCHESSSLELQGDLNLWIEK